jgi:Zn-dependent protease with chaperone function
MFGFFIFVPTHVVQAQINSNLLNSQENRGDILGVSYGAGSGLAATDPRVTIPRIINVILGLLGTVATVLMVYAGFSWMTAAGNDDKIETAKKTIFAAVLGLIIIMMSYAITRFVTTQSYTATTGGVYPDNRFGPIL